mmetsp:Transcript_171/g.517  ORF Transcript_171/g.517 Transcript_171/m.517 type:complete len:207 (+) Transcript_171:845-1465(+)
MREKRLNFSKACSPSQVLSSSSVASAWQPSLPAQGQRSSSTRASSTRSRRYVLRQSLQEAWPGRPHCAMSSWLASGTFSRQMRQRKVCVGTLTGTFPRVRTRVCARLLRGLCGRGQRAEGLRQPAHCAPESEKHSRRTSASGSAPLLSSRGSAGSVLLLSSSGGSGCGPDFEGRAPRSQASSASFASIAPRPEPQQPRCAQRGSGS